MLALQRIRVVALVALSSCVGRIAENGSDRALADAPVAPDGAAAADAAPAPSGDAAGITDAAAPSDDAPAVAVMDASGDGGGGGPVVITDPLAGLPSGAAQLRALCARGNGDDITRAFCATTTPPAVTSLGDLQRLVGLDPRSTTVSVALTAHSSSLVARFTSAINPRAIVFTSPTSGNTRLSGTPYPNTHLAAMGFVRGEQFVEMVANDPAHGNMLRFFLFRFEQACNTAPGGCTNGDLLTPAIERGFTNYTLYEDADLANTVFDCRQCHQPGGPSTPRILRQQELEFPWVHWLFDEPEGSVMLCNQFHAAHAATEEYGGIPMNLIGNSPTSCRPPRGGPPQLERFVENNGFLHQPNEYMGRLIQPEIVAVNPMQPLVNVPIGVSATWQGNYANYLSGQAIPPPYHDFSAADATRIATMTTAYRSVMSGATPRDMLPDIRDVFLDAALPDMTIRPHPGHTGRQILTEMCIQCHNNRLDQTITRARFNVERLDTMSRAEKDLAIARLHLPPAAAQHMPPQRFRWLDAHEIDLATQELMR